MAFLITIKRWHAVAEWTWTEGEDDDCGICRTAYDGCAPEVKYPGDDSPVVWGACGHAFHLQCIQKWLSSSSEQRCPMCRREWHYKSAAGQGAEPETTSRSSPANSLSVDQDPGQDQEQQQPPVSETEGGSYRSNGEDPNESPNQRTHSDADFDPDGQQLLTHSGRLQSSERDMPSGGYGLGRAGGRGRLRDAPAPSAGWGMGEEELSPTMMEGADAGRWAAAAAAMATGSVDAAGTANCPPQQRPPSGLDSGARMAGSWMQGDDSGTRLLASSPSPEHRRGGFGGFGEPRGRFGAAGLHGSDSGGDSSDGRGDSEGGLRGRGGVRRFDLGSEDVDVAED